MQPPRNRLKRLLRSLFLLVIFLMNGLFIPVNAAPPPPTEPTAAANAHAFYLPLIQNGEARKQWSGIHLGNIRTDARYEWHPATYWYLNPTVNRSAIWPALIVIQSNQIYEIHRDTNGVGCPIQNATVLAPEPRRLVMVAYGQSRSFARDQPRSSRSGRFRSGVVC